MSRGGAAQSGFALTENIHPRRSAAGMAIKSITYKLEPNVVCCWKVLVDGHAENAWQDPRVHRCTPMPQWCASWRSMCEASHSMASFSQASPMPKSVKASK